MKTLIILLGLTMLVACGQPSKPCNHDHDAVEIKAQTYESVAIEKLADIPTRGIHKLTVVDPDHVYEYIVMKGGNTGASNAIVQHRWYDKTYHETIYGDD